MNSLKPTATTEAEPNHLPYRRGAGLCLFNNKGLVFCAERRDQPGAWQMPQGGIQEGEDPAVAAVRELQEEIGIDTDKVEIIAKMPEALRYEFPDYLADKAFKGKYRGQEQIWFALRFLGTDADICLTNSNEPEAPEFINWKWMELAELPALIVPFKRPVYEQVVAHFAPLAQQLKQQ